MTGKNIHLITETNSKKNSLGTIKEDIGVELMGVVKLKY